MEILNKLDKLLQDREGKEKTHHYPTDAESCVLKLFNDWHGVEVTDPFDLTGIWKMEMGNAIHEQIDVRLKEIYDDVQTEVPFRADIGLKHELSGRMDNIIDQVHGVEIKSSFGRGIVDIQKKGEPKPEHIGQVALYLKYSGIEFEDFTILYMGRDSGYRTEFTISSVEDSYIEAIVDRFRIAEGDVAPDREFKSCIVNGEFKRDFTHLKEKYKGDWQCNYCKYRTSCWSDILAKQGKFIGEEKIV